MQNGHNSVPGQGWSNGDITPQLYAHTRQGRLELYQQHRRWIGLNQGWTRIGKEDNAHSLRTSFSQSTALFNLDPEEEAKSVRCLISQLCELFYRHGWATGTGGGVSIRVGGPEEGRPWRVFVAPSGIQKEDMVGDDIFELDMDRNVVVPPKTPNLKQSACTPLWYVVYKYRPNAKCVIHTHSMHAQMATLLDPTESTKTLRITHLEMLKGIGNHAYDDVLEIPIIDNRPSEDQLADQLESVIQEYPLCNAVLVRRHGVYVWGDSWEQAKTQCESFDYLFSSAVKMKQMGIDPAAFPRFGSYRVEGSSSGNKRARTENGFNAMGAVENRTDCFSNAVPILPRDGSILLLDIEGCTTSIAFVKDVLFPYVLEHIDAYLEQNYKVESQEYIKLCEELSQEVQENGGSSLSTPRPADMVRYLVENDVKAPVLKALQGNMWKAGYEDGKLKGHVYGDLMPMLEWMRKHRVKVYIYSSGSVQAQKLLFGHSTAGDLLPHMAGHFDISSAGNKKTASSYTKIADTLGVDPNDIVFVSDAEGELVAAEAAGVRPVMSIRPGNAPLTAVGKKFPTIYSLMQLCGAMETPKYDVVPRSNVE